MRVAITGAAGFLGQKLIARLVTGPEPVTALHLFDIVTPTLEPTLDCQGIEIRSMKGDISNSADIEALLNEGVDVIFHLAAVVSAAAEADLDLGLRVNLDGTRAILEACRSLPNAPKFIFTSSVAVYGGELPEIVTDHTAVTPQNSYGVQKVIGEQLVNDFSRRGIVDGRALRLPTIAVRPGRPNAAASSFASSIIREPLNGETGLLPVPESLPLYLLSPRGVIRSLMHALSLEASAWGSSRILMLPGISVTVADMLDALERIGGATARALVKAQPDPKIESIVGSWPARFDTARANALGFTPDRDMDAIIHAFLEEERP